MAAANNKVVHPISRRLKELDKTQKWLASEMQVSETTISNYVNRKVIPSKYDIKTKRMLRILGVDIQYLRTY